MDFSAIVKYALENKASDIHLSPNLPPIVRIYGNTKQIRIPAITATDIKNILNAIMSPDQRKIYESELELDFMCAIDGLGIRYRVNAYNTINGPAAAFREIPITIKSLAELKTPAIFESFTNFGRGIILVTGPTGSGKSTTLAAIINHINQNQQKHIITIEDPVEFVHKSQLSLVNQREVGSSTKSFAQALRSSLREDPDIILLGELRDIETISLALTAAETGHLVFGTLHTSSASKTVDRIIDVFPGENKSMIRTMLASSLQAVIAQRLFRKKDGTGRVAVHEIMIGTSAVRNLIRENKIPQIRSIIQVGKRYGMVLMEEAVMELVREGIIDKEEAREVFDADSSIEKNQAAFAGIESDNYDGSEKVKTYTSAAQHKLSEDSF